MNRWVALDPAYPPLAGDPLMAAPLLTTTTLLPGGSGFSSASRSQVNAILTSVCQLTENVSHVWYWSGRITGLAPATRMRTSGSYWSSRLHATVASAASATSVRMFALVVASSASAGPVRATATTGAPASANARAIPRPKPRLAPTTTVVLPDKSLITVLFLGVSMVSLAVVLVVAAPPEAGLVATEWRAVEPRVHAPEAVNPALVRRVGVVDDAILERERAHAGPFSPVGRPVRSNARRELGDKGTLLAAFRQPQVHRAEVVLDGSRLPLLLGVRHLEVVVEVAVERRRPGEAPAHAPLVRLQFRERSPRHRAERDVVIGEVDDGAVEAVRDRRAVRTPCRVLGPEHEVIDEELRASSEEIGEGRGALVGLEAVLLVDANPGQSLSPPRQFVAPPRQRLLGLEQLQPGRKPLFTCSGLMIGHCFSPLLNPFMAQSFHEDTIQFSIFSDYPVVRSDLVYVMN